MEHVPDHIPSLHPRDHDEAPRNVPTQLKETDGAQECPSCTGTMGEHQEDCILGCSGMTPVGLAMERAYRRGVQQTLVSTKRFLEEWLRTGVIEEMHILNVIESMGDTAGEMRHDEHTQYPLFLESLGTKIDLQLMSIASDEQ